MPVIGLVRNVSTVLPFEWWYNRHPATAPFFIIGPCSVKLHNIVCGSKSKISLIKQQERGSALRTLEQISFSCVPVKNSPMNKYTSPERFITFQAMLNWVSQASCRKGLKLSTVKRTLKWAEMWNGTVIPKLAPLQLQLSLLMEAMPCHVRVRNYYQCHSVFKCFTCEQWTAVMRYSK